MFVVYAANTKDLLGIKKVSTSTIKVRLAGYIKEL